MQTSQWTLAIAYLSDVPPSSKPGALAQNAWNTRGWNCPEFLPPNIVLFYHQEWTLYLGSNSPNYNEPVTIMQELGDNTDIDPEGIFKCFFQSKPVGAASAATPPATKLSGTEDIHASQKNLPQPKRKVPSHTIRVPDETELSELAKRLADAIPENELSVAAFQGYSLKNKVRPRECVEKVAQWVTDKRATGEKLRKKAEVRIPRQRRGMRDTGKLQWASTRVTTLQEDMAYSVFGIFGVHLPAFMVEGERMRLADS
ncbi:hypothetical protein M405DRAFT_205550 [Rhizopogon salebrosus TDB-379]|nr:hypothetical protein M405DRAFT_205550 [Rhizopogon salebrosus TDB-379]